MAQQMTIRDAIHAALREYDDEVARAKCDARLLQRLDEVTLEDFAQMDESLISSAGLSTGRGPRGCWIGMGRWDLRSKC